MGKQMDVKRIAVLVLAALVAACGGGGGDAPERPFGSVSGTAVDGIIVAGKVNAHAFGRAGKGGKLNDDAGLTDDSGAYSLAIQAPDQPVLLEVTGGRYVEEATGEEVALEPGQFLRAVGFYRSGKALNIMITPFTNLAAGLAEYKVSQGVDPATAINDALVEIESLYGFNVATTRPANVLVSGTAADQAGSEQLYGFYLAGISEWTKRVSAQSGAPHDQGLVSITLAQIMYNDIRADGVLDGRGYRSTDPGESEVVGLQFGGVALSQRVYRTELAETTLAFAQSERNGSGISVDKLTTPVLNLATKAHGLFGAAPAGESLEDIPFTITLDQAGQYFSRRVTFTPTVAGTVLPESVRFALDDIALEEAANPARPSVSFDTQAYADGRHTLSVTARSVFGKEWTEDFEVYFDNRVPTVQVPGNILTNQTPYRLVGTYTDPETGSGVAGITVGGQPATLLDQCPEGVEQGGADGCMSVDLDLTPGENTLVITVTDNIGNSNIDDPLMQQAIRIDLDTTVPQILPSPAGHGQARVSINPAYDCSAEAQPLEDQNDTLCIDTDALDLGDAKATRADLSTLDWPFFAFTVEDPDPAGTGVFTPVEKLTVTLDYLKNGASVTTRELKIADAESKEFIVPLAAEWLGEEWVNSIPGDKHLLRIAVEDEAGNIGTVKEFTFSTAFQVPELELAFTGFEQSFPDGFDPLDPFGTRSSLMQGSGFSLMAKYTLRNVAQRDVSVYLSEDGSTHVMRRTFTTVERRHIARKLRDVEWELTTVPKLDVACPGEDISFPEVLTVTTVYNWNEGSGQWEPFAIESQEIETGISLNTDDLSLSESDSVSDWRVETPTSMATMVGDSDYKARPPIVTLVGNVITLMEDYLPTDPSVSLTDPNPALVANWELSTSDGSSLGSCSDFLGIRSRDKYSLESTTGPVNTVIRPDLTDVVNVESSSDYSGADFEVTDPDSGSQVAEPVTGWFVIPSGQTVEIKKVITPPAMTPYNDGIVAEAEAADDANSDFADDSLYSKKRLDNAVSWLLDPYLEVTAVHGSDSGNFNVLPEVTQNISVGTLPEFSVSR
ncbi:MAG TPA: hypothetical protein ENJ19_00065 [Gammaproteobacteria bacterium]|nr:hypothetical protein [Gammaproteobacteria bacterium]